jgi:trehalose 6-phosphate phosphatase
MPPPLAEIMDRNDGRPLHLQFDFDGTLVPIATDPNGCKLDPELQQRLRQLQEHPFVTVAILSGRSLRDLSGRLGIQGLALAGNHGLEIAINGQHWRHPDAMALRPRLQQVAEQARLLLAEIPGAVVEDKGLTLSLHHRRVPAAWRALLQARLTRLEAPLADRAELTCRRGRKVVEIVPGLNWNKASAARLLCDRGGRAAGAAYVYAGDDVSDEDVFRAFPEGVTIKIGGDAKTTSAHYRLDSPAMLRQWLLPQPPV